MKSSHIITITTAVKLTPAHLNKTVAAIEKKTGKKATEVKAITDESLIGGIKVAINNTEYDNTVKGKLASVHQAMLKNV